MSRLDELLAQARAAEPDELHPAEVDREVRRAAMTGRARHRAWVRRRVTAVTAVSAALAAAAATIFMLGPAEPEHPTASAPAPIETHEALDEPEPDEPESPTRLELETGDRLVATEGARFSVERATGRERLIELGTGTMLFDVRPLDGGRFTVVTSDARVTVLGTVFTVQAGPGGTVVRVYEGRVRVEHEGRSDLVAQGGSAHVGEGSTPTGADPLEEQAQEAAALRGARAEASPMVQAPARPAAPVADVPAPAPAAVEPAPAPAERPEIGPDDLRGWIASGEPRRALDEARAHTARGDLDPWLMLEADALRAMREDLAAARTYQRVARTSPAPRQQQAGYLAARLLSRRDPGAALSQLDEASVLERGSPLRERGLALRVDLLDRLGRGSERDAAARRYLALYPDGSRAEHMRSSLGGAGLSRDP